MVKNNETLSKDDAEALEALYAICHMDLEEDQLNRTRADYVKKLQEINHDFLNHCRMEEGTGMRSYGCSWNKKISQVVTGEGICYTYNMLDFRDMYTNKIAKSLRYPNHRMRSNWTISGYPDNEPETYPNRVMGSGKRIGLFLSLSMEKKDIDYACKGAVNGFRVTLHTPDEFPRTASHFVRLPFDTATLLAVTPRGFSTSENMRNYKPVKRQCFFPGEKRLEFFKSYTQSNCKLECLAGELNFQLGNRLF